MAWQTFVKMQVERIYYICQDHHHFHFIFAVWIFGQIVQPYITSLWNCNDLINSKHIFLSSLSVSDCLIGVLGSQVCPSIFSVVSLFGEQETWSSIGGISNYSPWPFLFVSRSLVLEEHDLLWHHANDIPLLTFLPLDGYDYALAIAFVIFHFRPTESERRTAGDSSSWIRKALATHRGPLTAEGGAWWERTDGVRPGVIRSRHPSAGGEEDGRESPSALEDSSLILLCQLSSSAGYCFIRHVTGDFPNRTLRKSSSASKCAQRGPVQIFLPVYLPLF